MSSVWELIKQLVQKLHTFCVHMAQDRWWPADGPPPDPRTVLWYELPNVVRYTADAPGLSVRVRVTWQLSPHSPPLGEWPLTSEALPAFQPRLDEAPLEHQRFLLVEFDTPPQCTAEEWEQAYRAPPQDQWDALQKTRKSLTLHVRLVGQYEEWYPQDRALWTAPLFPINKPKRSIQEGLRAVDRARRNPTIPSPREALVQVLEQALQEQEKDGLHTIADPVLHYVVEETLAQLGARSPGWEPLLGVPHPDGRCVVDYVFPQHSERQPLGWLPVWIEPGQTPIEDTQWLLVTYLLQEQMIDGTSEIASFLQRYMGQFRYAASQEERALLQEDRNPFLLAGGGEGFAKILRTYAYPEHWKQQRRYITRTLSSLRATEARKHAEYSAHHVALEPEKAEAVLQQKCQRQLRLSTQPVVFPREVPQHDSVDEVARGLQVEATLAGVNKPGWPSRDIVYDWINKGHRWYGKIIVIRDSHNASHVTPEGLKQARMIVQAQGRHDQLWKKAEKATMSQANFNQLFQRKKKPDGTPDFEAIEAHMGVGLILTVHSSPTLVEGNDLLR